MSKIKNDGEDRLMLSQGRNEVAAVHAKRVRAISYSNPAGLGAKVPIPVPTYPRPAGLVRLSCLPACLPGCPPFLKLLMELANRRANIRDVITAVL